MDDVRDPGWPVPQVLTLLIPVVGIYVMQARARRQPTDGVVTLRTTYVTFTPAVPALGLLCLFLHSGQHEPNHPATLVAGGLLAIAALANLVMAFREPKLDTTDLDTLGGTYRTRYFVRMALAEALPLLGFLGLKITGSLWPYGVGVVLALPAYARAVPSAGRLRREQHELADHGSGLSLLAALGAHRPSST